MSIEAVLDKIDTKLTGIIIRWPSLKDTIWKHQKHVQYAIKNVDKVDSKKVLHRTAYKLQKVGNEIPALRETLAPLIEQAAEELGFKPRSATR